MDILTITMWLSVNTLALVTQKLVPTALRTVKMVSACQVNVHFCRHNSSCKVMLERTIHCKEKLFRNYANQLWMSIKHTKTITSYICFNLVTESKSKHLNSVISRPIKRQHHWLWYHRQCHWGHVQLEVLQLGSNLLLIQTRLKKSSEV